MWIAEGVDVAIRVRPPPLEDSDLLMKVLSERTLSIVASPDLVNKFGAPKHLCEIADWPSLGLGTPQKHFTWSWTSPDEQSFEVPFKPRFITTDMVALRDSALAGVGVVQLPKLLVANQINDGSLVELFPD